MKKLIITSVVAAGLFTACGNKPEDTKHETTTHEQKVQEHKEVVKKAVEKVQEHKEVVKQEVAKVAQKVEAKKEEVKQEVAKVAQTVETKKEEVKQEVAKVTQAVETKKEEAKASIDVNKLYAACAGCHGMNAEKKALGQSAVIKGWEVAKLEKALHGYKDGSYGGAMKGVMKGQVMKLDDAQITALAKHISSL